jgi:hypothetical protein
MAKMNAASVAEVWKRLSTVPQGHKSGRTVSAAADQNM